MMAAIIQAVLTPTGGERMRARLHPLVRWAAVLILLIACFCLLHRCSAFRVQPDARTTPIGVNDTPVTAIVSDTPDPYWTTRAHMVEFDIEQRGITEPEVLRAARQVPRHEFVLPEYLSMAYADRPLPIGYGQTISQPYIVAVMTELLRLKPGDRVLEVGTGSGYQAAILAELTKEVYSVEIIEELHLRATETLNRLGYPVITKHADGYYGWEEHSPYDAIIVTAAPDHIPQPLVQQLGDGGRLVIPVGPKGAFQTLWLVEKQGEDVTSRNVMGVVFVPLTGEYSQR
jgi:protein-L-isoaspartate(D-aspartate) O-methyltransferase